MVATNEGTKLVPLAANPILGVLFVHVKVPPTGKLTKFAVGTIAPGQTEKEVGVIATGLGFTVIETICGTPTHPVAVDVAATE